MKKQSLAAAAAFALAASILAAGCGKKETASTETSAETSAVEESTEASTEETEESTQEETEESEAQEAAQYHMLQGTIVKMGAEGNVFTLQADDGNSYDIGLTDIRDVEVELAQDGGGSAGAGGVDHHDGDRNYHGQCYEHIFHEDRGRQGAKLYERQLPH